MEEENRQRELLTKLIAASNVLAKASRKPKADYVVVSPEMMQQMKEMKDYIEILERMKNRNKGIDNILD